MDNKTTIINGLTSKQVEESRTKYGSNVLTPPTKSSLWHLFLEHFNDPIIKILLVACVLSVGIACFEVFGPESKGFITFMEPLGIILAVLLASGVGFFFEMRANKAFTVLNSINDDTKVKVIRDNHVHEINRKEIVKEDIVILDTGDEVPADGLLIEALSLQVDESSLTGEPLAFKTVKPELFDPEATYASNKVMRGSNILEGHGIMKVTAVGDATAYGKVYEGAQVENDLQTPLQQQLSRLAALISKVGYSMAGLTFICLVAKLFISPTELTWITSVNQVLNAFMIAVTLIVVSVPEGLPMSVSLSLALSMNRMLKANNLVRKMHACETMGATTVICTDKTGTLTKNQMHVYEMFVFGTTTPSLDNKTDEAIYLKEAIAINSTAMLDDDKDPIKVLGNPTEGALLLWLNLHNIDYITLRENTKIVKQLTFSTERKYMATIVRSATGKLVLYVKGASEILLRLCNPTEEEEIMHRLETYQEQGMRTLGFAYKVLEEKDLEACFKGGTLTTDHLIFMGVTAISDPIRENVPEAVRSCINAGIEIKIVTGDTARTAQEIGRQIGIIPTTNTKWAMTGVEFNALSDIEALEAIKSLRILSRARPLDKQRLVNLLQQQGEVVAVTGDGTNDAPALNLAQVGLSMGSGTAVAKEASDITIIDNSFHSITNAVMWGRSLYRNIQKFLLFQLTINVAACFIVLLGSLIGTESPLTVTQMLWVNLIMDTFAAGALASLPPNTNVLKEKPRKSGPQGDFIISRPMALNIGFVGGSFVVVLMSILFYFHLSEGLSPYHLTWFFTFFVSAQLWNLFNAKAFLETRSAFAGLREAKSFLAVVLLILIGQYLIVSFGGKMFNVTPLAWKDWGLIIGSSSIVLWIGELIRWIQRTRTSK